MDDEYIKYLYTDKDYNLIDVRGKKTPADAQAEGDRLASILKIPIGVFRLEHISGVEYAAQHCVHPTSGDSPASEVLPTGEVAPSNQVISVPPTCG